MAISMFRRSAAAACCAGAVAASAMLGGSASAAPAAPPSTPISFPAADGEVMSYVVNAKHANHGQMKQVLRAVEAAGGVVVQEWPEIGVVVVQSTRADFRADVVKYSHSSVKSVGATRTIPVAGGTSAGISTLDEEAAGQETLPRPDRSALRRRDLRRRRN